MKTNNSGFTLAEVLVSIVIGVISITAAFASYNYFNKSYKSVSQKAAINSSAREALTVISRDLRNAGYVDINYNKVAKSEIKSIYLQQKTLESLDSLTIWYTTSPNDMMRVEYKPIKYQGSNKKYLARSVVMNPDDAASKSTVYDNEEFVSNIADFQVVIRDKEGIDLPSCSSCKAHTTEIYLTIESAKEIFNSKQKTRIINHEDSAYGNTLSFDDKYYRETFFASVHTRNLSDN